MAAPTTGLLESATGGLPLVSSAGLNTNKAVNFSGFQVDSSGNVTNISAPLGPQASLTVNSALVGATVALTAAQSGQTFINVSTSGSPSWTLPAAANGLLFTFVCGNTTAGFTVTGGTIKCKTTATGTALSGTTLTNTQATAVVDDNITLSCDGTVWWAISQSGIFACA
jgi:hypothetical protein